MLVEIGTDGVLRGDASYMAHKFDIPFANVRSRIANGNLLDKAICEDAAVVSAMVNALHNISANLGAHDSRRC